jgi:hypothetical protein
VGVCHCLLPLLAIPLTFILIPDKLMTDKILDDDAAAAADAAPAAGDKAAEPLV